MISARSQRLMVSALLAMAVLAVYWPLTGYEFINLDDAEYVRENANINGGFSWASVKWVCENPVAGNWHPVTMLSHLLDCQVYGLNPGRHHLTNVLFHAANTLLLFWVLLAMTNKLPDATGARVCDPPQVGCKIKPVKSFHVTQSAEHPGSQVLAPGILWPCALVAALFGLHPLHVESVAWVSERKDVLSTLFFLLTLWAYTRHAQRMAARTRPFFFVQSPFYWLAMAWFTLGLMSKAMLVTLPFVLLLLDYWPLGRLKPDPRFIKGKTNEIAGPVPFTWLLLEKTPFLLLAAIFSLITFKVQQDAGAVVTLKHFPIEARLANAVVSYAHYLGRTLWPDSLAMLYSYQGGTAAQIAGAAALFAALTCLALWTARRHRYVLVGWCWFVGMLVPVIGLVQVGLQVMADRYTYLPLIGIFIALAWGLAELAGSPAGRRLTAAGAVLALACLSVATARQVRFWKNSETLFTHSLQVTGHGTMAHYILGAICDSQGRTGEARAHFAAAIADNPANVKARCGLAYIDCGQGNLATAAEEYQTALRFEPNSAKAHFGLAEARLKQHQPDAAMEQYLLALKANPNIAEAHYQLAGILGARQDAASAIAHLEEAVRLQPDWPLALNNLAWNLATQPEPALRNGAEATQLAARAVRLTGNNPRMLDTLAAAYAEAGRFTDAVATAESAIQIAGATGQTNLVTKLEFRLKAYQAQQPVRD